MVHVSSGIFETGFDCLKIFVNFDFASWPFHSFAALEEKHFWPYAVCF